MRLLWHKGKNEYVLNLRPCSNLILSIKGKSYTAICTTLQRLHKNSVLIYGATTNIIIWLGFASERNLKLVDFDLKQP